MDPKAPYGQSQDWTETHLANGPWNKAVWTADILPTKLFVIPKSLSRLAIGQSSGDAANQVLGRKALGRMLSPISEHPWDGYVYLPTNSP